jgi:hypothetical protein
MVVRGYVLGVRCPPSKLLSRCLLDPVDFAMTEAAYAVVRIFQQFPVIRLPSNEVVKKTGKERQTITIVLSVGDGCRVCFE